MAHFRTFVKWNALGSGEEERMRLAAHAALDDLLRNMKRKGVEPVADRQHQRKLELIINAGAE